jgi:hypothetical protein
MPSGCHARIDSARFFGKWKIRTFRSNSRLEMCEFARNSPLEKASWSFAQESFSGMVHSFSRIWQAIREFAVENSHQARIANFHENSREFAVRILIFSGESTEFG